MSTTITRPRITLFAGLAMLGVPYSKRQIARLEAAGKFPKRVAIGEKMVGWVTDEVVAHVDRWVAARDADNDVPKPERTRPQRKRAAPMLGSAAAVHAQS